jgi:hypothetical protein
MSPLRSPLSFTYDASTCSRSFLIHSQSWPSGVQDSQQKFPGCLQMKLRGNPWHTIDSAQVVAARVCARSSLLHNVWSHRLYRYSLSIC